MTDEMKELKDAIRDLRREVDDSSENVKQHEERVESQMLDIMTNLKSVVEGHNKIIDDIAALAKEMNRFQVEGIAPLIEQNNKIVAAAADLKTRVEGLEKRQ